MNYCKNIYQLITTKLLLMPLHPFLEAVQSIGFEYLYLNMKMK